MNKILHIWDQAAVSCTLAKFQRKLNYETQVIKRAGFDPFGIINFYGEKEVKPKFRNNFYKVALKKAQNYDIIHIHDLFELVPKMRRRFINKAIILHYHGTILRNTHQSVREESECLANKVLVSTPDLKQFVDGIYLPNPVDTEHFSPRISKKNNKAICIMSSSENEQVVEKLLYDKNFDMEIDFMSREKQPISYSAMPDFLSNYEYFVDLKLIYEGKPAPVFAMLGLQALSLGLKVINYKFKVKNNLPIEHKPENVVNQLIHIYNN